ncbi:MAG: hypothetical protein ABI876_01840 [Bacteroidota bacterium]
MTDLQSSDFTRWLLDLHRNLRRIYWLPAIGLMASAAWAALFKSILPDLLGYDSNTIIGIVCLVEFLAIAFLAMKFQLDVPDKFPVSSLDAEIRQSLGYANEEKWVDAKDNALRSLGKFHRHVTALWIAWLCLYAALAVPHLLPHGSEFIAISCKFLADIFHACVPFTVWLCYLSISIPANAGKGKRKAMALNLPYWLICFAFILIIQLGISSLSAYDPKYLITASITASDLSFYFKAILSTLTGGVMCMLVGQLDSKFLRTPPWFLFMMYCYAAIHVMYAVFEKPGWEVVELVVIGLMLIFKVALYLFVAWMINSGRLLFYFVKVQQIQEHEDRGWSAFQKLLPPDMPGE